MSRLTIRRINSILTVKNRIFLNFHTSTVVVARQFEKCCTFNSRITCYFHQTSKLLNRQNLKFYNLSCSFNRINVHPPFVSYYNAIISITFRSLVDILSISLLNVESSSINISVILPSLLLICWKLYQHLVFGLELCSKHFLEHFSSVF